MNPFRVDRVQNPIGTSCIITMDECIALDFRNYHVSPGPNYLQVGNRSTDVLELAFDPDSCQLCHVALIAFEDFVRSPDVQEIDSVNGLPVLSIDWARRSYIHILHDLMVSRDEDSLLIRWGDVSKVSVVTFDRFQSLIVDNELRGVRVVGLSEHENVMLDSHGRAQQRLRASYSSNSRPK